MEEEKTTEEKKEEKKELTIVDRAEAANVETARLQEEKKILLDREEKLKAEKLLGGTTDAAIEPEKKEETNHEYRLRIEKELAEGKFNK